MADLQEALDVIQAKVALYADRVASGSADSLWGEGPEYAAAQARLLHLHLRCVRYRYAQYFTGFGTCSSSLDHLAHDILAAK